MRKRISGIYTITNTIRNRFYLGSSVDIYERFNAHKRHLQNNKHCNQHLQNAWTKYGKDAFLFQLEMEIPVDELRAVEQLFLNFQQSYPGFYYNISIDAECPTRGRKCSEETKRRMSLSRTGLRRKPFSPEHRQKISLGHQLSLANCKPDVFTLHNTKTGEIFTGTRHQFSEKYQIPSSGNLSNLLNKKWYCKSLHGWQLAPVR